jgi:hypothetical protein
MLSVVLLSLICFHRAAFVVLFSLKHCANLGLPCRLSITPSLLGSSIRRNIFVALSCCFRRAAFVMLLSSYSFRRDASDGDTSDGDTQRE